VAQAKEKALSGDLRMFEVWQKLLHPAFYFVAKNKYKSSKYRI